MTDSDCRCEIFNAAGEGIARQPEAESKINSVLLLITTFIDTVRCVKTCDGKNLCDNDGFSKFVEALNQSGAFFEGIARQPAAAGKITVTLLMKMFYYLNLYILAKYCYSKCELALIYKEIINKFITNIALYANPIFFRDRCSCVLAYEFVVIAEPYTLVLSRDTSQYVGQLRNNSEKFLNWVNWDTSLNLDYILNIVNGRIMQSCDDKCNDKCDDKCDRSKSSKGKHKRCKCGC